MRHTSPFPAAGEGQGRSREKSTLITFVRSAGATRRRHPASRVCILWPAPLADACPPAPICRSLSGGCSRVAFQTRLRAVGSAGIGCPGIGLPGEFDNRFGDGIGLEDPIDRLFLIFLVGAEENRRPVQPNADAAAAAQAAKSAILGFSFIFAAWRRWSRSALDAPVEQRAEDHRHISPRTPPRAPPRPRRHSFGIGFEHQNDRPVSKVGAGRRDREMPVTAIGRQTTIRFCSSSVNNIRFL